MVSDKAFIFHICIPCGRIFYNEVEVICQGQYQISRSHLSKQEGQVHLNFCEDHRHFFFLFAVSEKKNFEEFLYVRKVRVAPPPPPPLHPPEPSLLTD